MFSLFSGIYDFTKKPKREDKILVLGLDGSGKSTLINSLKKCATTQGLEGYQGGEFEANKVSPTLGLNLVKIELPSSIVDLMEIGGKESFRSMWSHYYEDADKILFIVDASSSETLSGICTTKFLGTETNSACCPLEATLSPTLKLDTPLPTAITSPTLQ